jgi:hypothetical protein
MRAAALYHWRAPHRYTVGCNERQRSGPIPAVKREQHGTVAELRARLQQLCQSGRLIR